MIASLRGTVIQTALDHIIVECHGVGYKVLCTPRTIATARTGEEVFIRTTMVIREDSHTLYGFSDEAEQSMFSLLQTVSGMGPKITLATQAMYTAPELAKHIAQKDAKALQAIPGVGKRAAERMIVDLKEKVQPFLSSAVSAEVSQPSSGDADTAAIEEQVIAALAGLGFSEKTSMPVVQGILREDPSLDTSAVLRSALSALGRAK